MIQVSAEQIINAILEAGKQGPIWDYTLEIDLEHGLVTMIAIDREGKKIVKVPINYRSEMKFEKEKDKTKR